MNRLLAFFKNPGVPNLMKWAVSLELIATGFIFMMKVVQWITRSPAMNPELPRWAQLIAIVGSLILGLFISYLLAEGSRLARLWETVIATVYAVVVFAFLAGVSVKGQPISLSVFDLIPTVATIVIALLLWMKPSRLYFKERASRRAQALVEYREVEK